MSFSTRNPADLEVGKTYTFTRLLNGYSYKMTFTGTSQQRPPTQEAQYLGNDNPLETVYAFNCEYPSSAKSAMWVWTHDVKNGIYHDGTWTE
jgi:hypothetical protein